MDVFELVVEGTHLNFSSAHFVAYDGFREWIHGHNYQVSIRMKGEVCKDGLIIDKKRVDMYMKRICKELNGKFLCPLRSNVINCKSSEKQLLMKCQDGALFSFPESDCMMLPIVHSTVEELSHYLYNRLIHDLTPTYLLSRGVVMMQISVSEAPGQGASYAQTVPSSILGLNFQSPCKKAKPRPCFDPVD